MVTSWVVKKVALWAECSAEKMAEKRVGRWDALKAGWMAVLWV